jgi:hypothetical protein
MSTDVDCGNLIDGVMENQDKIGEIFYDGSSWTGFYSVTNSTVAKEALDHISQRLTRHSDISLATLSLVSIKESFDLPLLTQFYNQLMIPNFPLDDERDDLDDWLYCLDPVQKGDALEGPTMDVLLLIHRNKNVSDESDEVSILAGIVFEYYSNSQVGLLAYMVVADDYRRLGIVRSLHSVAYYAMEQLHQESSLNLKQKQEPHELQFHITSPPSIKAILAETNTIHAGDAEPEIIQKRHEVLYRLGYRHLQFPYVQPPLAENGQSFDEIVLLVYCGFNGESSNMNNKNTNQTNEMDTDILFQYVEDFYQSVFGYGDPTRYKQHWYFQLVEWFRIQQPLTQIARDLPWHDVTPQLQLALEEE